MVFHLEVPAVHCEGGVAGAAASFAWNDESAFFAPNGGERTVAAERITESGWYVWEIPSTRITTAAVELGVEVVATSDDGTPLELRVNLNDSPLIATTLVDPGSQTLSASVSIAPGTATKVGVYFANAAPGRSLEIRSLSLTSEEAPTECTEAPIENGLFKVDSWTVASRLSYAFTGMGPDDELLDAAADQGLERAEDVRVHAERLLRTNAARRQLARLLDSWLNLEAVPTPNRTIATLAGLDESGLAEEARQELIDYVT
jgi:hypothetical protein